MLEKSSGQGAGIEEHTLYLRLKSSTIMNRFVSVLEKFKSVSDLVSVGVDNSGTLRLRSSSMSIVLTAEFDDLETKWSKGDENDEPGNAVFDNNTNIVGNADQGESDERKRMRMQDRRRDSGEKSVNDHDDTIDREGDEENNLDSGREVTVQLRVLLKVLQCKSTEPHVVFIGIPPHGRYIHLIYVYNPDPREASSFNMLIKVPTIVVEEDL